MPISMTLLPPQAVETQTHRRRDVDLTPIRRLLSLLDQVDNGIIRLLVLVPVIYR